MPRYGVFTPYTKEAWEGKIVPHLLRGLTKAEGIHWAIAR